MYAVPEPKKRRMRCITHTRDINESCGPETLRKRVFPTKGVISKAVHDGDFLIALDFSAYYDRFKLEKRVAKRQCFEWNQRYFRRNNLAMGQRQSVGIGCAATDRLLDFPKQSRCCMSIIDNVVFIGDREDVINDAWTFVQRCRKVRAVLNEVDVPKATRDDLAALATQESDWGGVRINLADKTAALTDKCVQKVRTSWSNRADWQWRDYAAHMGLLFWAWGIIHLPMAEFFAVLRFNSEIGKRIMHWYAAWKLGKGFATDDTPKNPFWRAKADIWDSVVPVLERWTNMLLENRPRVIRPDADPEVIFECDASNWGWSCCGLHVATDTPFSHSEPWSPEMRRRFGAMLRHSTFAEPHAVTYSLLFAQSLFPHARRFGTTNDNTAAVNSHDQGFNFRSYKINECVKKAERSMPRDRYTVNFLHVAGVNNVADGGSRGRVVHELTGEQRQQLRSRWGLSTR
jgi:hypothetical protein